MYEMINANAIEEALEWFKLKGKKSAWGGKFSIGESAHKRGTG
ncbi:hypothetical protein [Gimesia benthica]|nr:hypothetical protein [Gimesia benthica]